MISSISNTLPIRYWIVSTASDTNKDKTLDSVVSDAIATVAGNIDSIKSPYHQTDMKLIATSGSDCLQSGGSYPKESLNNLADNQVS